MDILPVAVGDALTREEGQVVRLGDEEESESEEEDEELFFSDSSSIGPELTASQPEGSKYTLRELPRFLNETKGKKVNLEAFFSDPRKFVRSVQHAMKNEGHGVLSPRKRFRLRKWVTTVCKGRLLVVKAEINNMGFVFINVYAPYTGRERGVLFGSLRQELSQVAPEEKLVVGGDWNCTMDFTKDRNGEEPHSVGVLRDILNQFDLVDVCRTKHPNTRQYTWVKVFCARVSAALLDRFYMSRNRSNRLLGATILLVGFSDHHITMARLSLTRAPAGILLEVQCKALTRCPFLLRFPDLLGKVGSAKRGV
ncbi:unnamed protein product [Oncorhynchus mykiss]|uniref:Endonuclease/exonuclease/phosphatase domain-containing protein n=1 Tax=Oncorhynchus mykiss TaxID=8022 RepID=A0A060WG78_ONCMY|nr:unnamed protein product [Oncorhynchus mykiss]